MKDQENPAYQLTSKAIWQAFKRSGKKHILLTGSKESGKSTLFAKLYEENMPGYTTWAEPGKQVMLKENFSGESIAIAQYCPSLPGKENKMLLDEAVFLRSTQKIMAKAIESASKWVAIDEIGYMECKVEAFCKGMRRLMDAKQVLAVIRKQELKFLNELKEREDVFLIDMDEPFGKVGCVVMASGMGKRFGENKLLALFDNKPLISHILEKTNGLFEKRVVVTRHEEIVELCKNEKISFIMHDLPYRSDTIRLGVQALSDCESILFCPSDQPLLSRDSIIALLLVGRNMPNSICRLANDKRPGAPVLFSKKYFHELAILTDGEGGKRVIKHHLQAVKYVETSNCYELLDIDTQKDRSILEAVNKQRRKKDEGTTNINT